MLFSTTKNTYRKKRYCTEIWVTFRWWLGYRGGIESRSLAWDPKGNVRVEGGEETGLRNLEEEEEGERKCTPEMQFEKTSFFDNFRTKVSRILRVNCTGAGVKRGFFVGLNMNRFSICSNNNMVLRPDPRVLLLHGLFLSSRFLNIGPCDDRPTQPN